MLKEAPADQLPRVEGLVPLAPESLPFAPSLTIRAFLLQRDRGNLLVYSTRALDREADAIRRAGGVARHYLNHAHEAMFATGAIAAPLFCHEAERASVAEAIHVRATFSRRHLLDDDFEVIPTPGHTAGATAFLWNAGDHRLLFTGDTVYISEGEWVAGVLGSSDRAAYVDSLELIRDLDFDVLVPWAASAGGPHLALTDAADARARIDAILTRVRAGSDH